MKLPKLLAVAALALALSGATSSAQDAPTFTPEGYEAVEGRWPADKANAWYDALPWLVGANYYPHTAINAIEMWQASTWDPDTIAMELDLAESIGMNTMRVYLHDLVWADDAEGLYERMDAFLAMCDERGIKPFFVFFDDCHYPTPKLGEQPLPVKEWHNSGWVNSPGRDLALRYANGEASEEEVANLKGYVQETMRRFSDDDRVLMWELYNEPGRGNSTGEDMTGTAMQGRDVSIGDQSNQLLHDSFVWAREVAPTQPVCATSAGSLGDMNIAIARANSDVQSIHSYEPPQGMRRLIADYKRDGRPLLMTEWLARTRGNTVEDNLPILKRQGVAAINWGFVIGKTETHYPWSSRRRDQSLSELREAGEVIREGDPIPEPELWFHDLFRADGTPFSEEEIAIFKRLTGVEKGEPAFEKAEPAMNE